MNLEQFIPNNKKQVFAGIVGGIVVSIITLLIINMLFWSFPMNPMVYTYDYSNGTNAVSPISQESLNVHGSGVALTNMNYSVEYTEEMVLTESNQKITNTQITYQINNSDRTGKMYVLNQQRTNGLNNELVTLRNQTITANESKTIVNSHLNNTTQTFKTGSEPILLHNQLRLPKAYVSTAPHVNWEATSQTVDNGQTTIVYKPSSVNASNSPLDTITSVNGTLTVNTETGIITYELETTGTLVIDGQEKKVTHRQEFSYTNLSD